MPIDSAVSSISAPASSPKITGPSEPGRFEWTRQGTDVFLGRRIQIGLPESRSSAASSRTSSPNRCLVQRELCNPAAKPKPEILDGRSIHPSTLKSISVTDQSVPLTTGA